MRTVSIVGLFALLTIAMTWPQARHLSSHVPPQDDPLLSIWRISWIAHALPASPGDLLNGNIFYPDRRTLAYTDAVLLQGVSAAPFIWAGVSPVTAYNVLLLACMALSGAAMFLYACRLTASPHAALLAGIVFAFVPFRFEHLHHLELQATMFLPLTLWWIERALDSGDRRDVFGAAASFVAQTYCGIYYAVFLATAIALVLAVRVPMATAATRRALLKPALAATAVAALAILPYLLAYLSNRSTLGDRRLGDIARYSATLGNYLGTPVDNIVHGWWSYGFGANERRLFPGALAIGLALIGAVGFERRRATLVIVGVTGLVISMGVHTPLYDAIRAALLPYRGLRAPARASILVFLAIAGLAALGWTRILPRLQRWRTPITAAVAAAMLLEYSTVLHSWLVLPARPPAVYAWLKTQPRSVVVEFPLPAPDNLGFTYDGLYMLGSTTHWQPILNGYSGYYPQSFIELTEHGKTFPDEASIAFLKRRGVDLIIVHGGYMPPDAFVRITAELLARQDVQTVTRFEEPEGPDMVFRLEKVKSQK